MGFDRLGQGPAGGLSRAGLPGFCGWVCDGGETSSDRVVVPDLGLAEVPRFSGLKGEIEGHAAGGTNERPVAKANSIARLPSVA